MNVETALLRFELLSGSLAEICLKSGDARRAMKCLMETIRQECGDIEELYLVGEMTILERSIADVCDHLEILLGGIAYAEENLRHAKIQHKKRDYSEEAFEEGSGGTGFLEEGGYAFETRRESSYESPTRSYRETDGDPED